MIHSLPKIAWCKRFDEQQPDPSIHTFSRPPLHEAIFLIPLAFRIQQYMYKEKAEGKDSIFDLNGLTLDPPTPGPNAGVPIGGIGSGSINRGYTGEFRGWSLHPGKYIHKIVEANQFSIRVKRRGSVVRSQVLSLLSKKQVPILLSSWNWSLPKSCGRYYALFPRSWTVYDEPIEGIRVVIKQISPVIPGNYSESSLPCCVFEVEVENLHDDDAEVSVMFTFANYNGTSKANSISNFGNGPLHAPFIVNANQSPTNQRVLGVCMSNNMVHTAPDGGHNIIDNESFSIATSCSTDGMSSCCDAYVIDNNSISQSQSIAATMLQSIFYSNRSNSIDSDTSAQRLWEVFTTTGDITGASTYNETSSPPPSSTVLGSAVCLRKIVKKGDVKTFPFSLAFDMPIARFGEKVGVFKYYTNFFGTTGLASSSISTYALTRYPQWDQMIEEWQEKIVSDIPTDIRNAIPEYYLHQLFNELYYLVDGGSIWSIPTDTTGVVGNNSSRSDGSVVTMETLRASADSNTILNTVTSILEMMEINNEVVSTCNGNDTIVGNFLYLEGHEYLMYNTYDVHFYSSFSLLMLYPQIELSIQNDVAAAVLRVDDTMRPLLFDGKCKQRKVYGVVPHDMGSPFETPWVRVNAYNLQDVSKWKDLGPKFVLQIYRDYLYIQSMYTGSIEFLSKLYDTVLLVMTGTLLFDRDGDGMIENEGFPDQTYDVWTVEGVSCYCGGLFIAACFAMSKMSDVMYDKQSSSRFYDIAIRGRRVYFTKLWNGQYLNYDSSTSAHHDSVMADMMAGQFMIRVCKLDVTVSSAVAYSCYRSIYELNVIQFAALSSSFHISNGSSSCSSSSSSSNSSSSSSTDNVIGAVNGMRPNSTIDDTCLQSREVWTGTTYMLAAGMIAESISVAKASKAVGVTGSSVSSGLDDIPQALDSVNICDELISMAFTTARGVSHGGWNRFGYQFNTPEGYEKSGNYRSLGYMRPLSIWAMQYALTHD